MTDRKNRFDTPDFGALQSWRLGCEQAYQRIRPHIEETPCTLWPAFSERVGAEVFLKLENRQKSGSFKLRGVTNKILALDPEERDKVLIAASTGNHAAAFANALERFGLRGRLFLPHTIAPVKLAGLRRAGVPIEFAGDDCVQTEIRARQAARKAGGILVPPYNDADVICGQGTVAVELARQVENLDAVLVPIGGGGLAAGVAAYLKAISQRIEIIGCQPARSAIMYRSVLAGRIVDEPSGPTLSDATAGGIEPGAITFKLCQKYVDRYTLLSEDEIKEAIVFLYRHCQMTVEGGGALSTAAALKEKERLRSKRVALIVSGGRIDEAVVEEMLRRHV